MLTETHKVKQSGDKNLRRWFSDKHFDLIVWYKPDRKVLGFQLCYKLGHHEKALTWLLDKGFSHDRIDDGEGDIATYKMTPILVPDGTFDKRSILALFKKGKRGYRRSAQRPCMSEDFGISRNQGQLGPNISSLRTNRIPCKLHITFGNLKKGFIF